MNAIFGHMRLDRRDFGDLFASWFRVVRSGGKSLPAFAALLGFARDGLGDSIRFHQRPDVAFVTFLPPAFSARWLCRRFAFHVESRPIARWRHRGIRRVLAERFAEFAVLNLELSDLRFEFLDAFRLLQQKQIGRAHV